MDITELLTKDHREAAALFARFPTEASETQKRSTAEALITELSRHDAVEVQVLYPALRKLPERGAAMAGHALDEHREARELLAELDDSLDQVMTDSYLSSWRRLEQMIAAHVEEEEQQIFPLLRAHHSEDELEKLGGSVETAKKMAPTHPHPSTPDNPVGATVMGAAAGVLDRVGDAVTGRGKH